MSPEFEKFLMNKIDKTESFLCRLFHAIVKAFIVFFVFLCLLGLFSITITFLMS